MDTFYPETLLFLKVELPRYLSTLKKSFPVKNLQIKSNIYSVCVCFTKFKTND